MHTEPTHGEVRHHKPRHVAQKMEGMLGTAMVIAIVLLAIGLIYGIMTAGEVTPKWMQ
jgi:cell division protein FtsL